MGDGTQPSEGASLAEDLLKRCHLLLSELEDFKSYLIKESKENAVELKPFRNSVISEIKSLEKLASADPTAERTVHTLRSSNLPFHSAVWNAAKASTGLVAFNKRFYWNTPSPTRTLKRAGAKPKHRSALVDVVTQEGQQWIKISTVTEKRMLFEMAKARWEGAASSSDDEEDGTRVNGLAHTQFHDGHVSDEVSSDNDEEDDDRVEIIRQVLDLQKASQAHKVRYRHPSVKVILPKISQNPPIEICQIIDRIRSSGAIVQLGPTPTSSDLPSVMRNLLSNPFEYLTPILNIDCTILLALVSDLSHCPTHPEPWFHKAITRQIEIEGKERLLPSHLWPAMAGRELVCTEEAAKRMREIVDGIGTETERVRTDLLLAPTDPQQQQQQQKFPPELRAALAMLSNYDIPSDWNVPIKIVPAGLDMQKLPPVAGKVKEALTAINQSVFLFGWMKGWTTLSSNRAVAKQIEEIVEGEEGEEIGPDIWLCATARSLVGKEKGRRDNSIKND